MPSDFKAFYNEILQTRVDETIPDAIRRDYEFLSCIAFDEKKELYLVSGRQDGKKRVLRVTKAEAGDDARAEAGILSALNHPAVPKITALWSEPGKSYLLREYFDGITLHDLVKRQGILNAGRIIEIVTELCDVLYYLHSRNPIIIHRDVKPENIILTKDGGVKLIDFGIAREYSLGAIKDTTISGTRPYMAPEQFGSEQTDGRADIFALGAVMIYMATGETDKSDLKKTYPIKPLVPIIQKCIKKDPDQRFAGALQLKRRLLRYKRKTVKKLLAGAAALMCIAAAFIIGAYIGHEQGYTGGFDAGHADGFESGLNEGHERGYDNGFDAGHTEGYGGGFDAGLEQGFQNGVDSIMDVPTERNQPFTQEELNQPITFESWYLDLAVRNILNKQPEVAIYRYEVNDRIDAIQIFGTHIIHPGLNDQLIKTHKGKGTVSYSTGSGIWLDARGDISSLDDIPDMYYLRTLALTSQFIDDLTPIAGMKLEVICLADNFIGNLLPIKDMAMLRELDVCQNPLRDLTPISRLLSLEKLDFSQTQVTDLSPLSNLTKLQTVSLAYCDVDDISVLANMPDLRELDISHTLVADLAPILGRKEPLTIICAGLPDEVTAQAAGLDNITIVKDEQ